KTQFCMWSDINDSGAFYAAVNSDANLTRWSISTAYCRQGTWNDCASSAYNYGTSGMGVFMYQDINYGGGDFCLPNYSGLDNFTVVTFNNSWVGLNDNVSSLRWSRSSICSADSGPCSARSSCSSRSACAMTAKPTSLPIRDQSPGRTRAPRSRWVPAPT